MFEVKDYVLPTYSVNVDLPERAPIPEATFPVTVKALYTFGEAVEGEAVVTFYTIDYVYGGGPQEPSQEPEMPQAPSQEPEMPQAPEGPQMPQPQAPEQPIIAPTAPVEIAIPIDQPVAAPAPVLARQARQAWWGGWEQPTPVRKNLYVKTVQISSAPETFSVSILNDLKITYDQSVSVEVVFTEKLTKKTAKANGNVHIAQYAYELILTASDTFELGQPYSFTVSARNVGTGTPVSYIENRL
jgi:Macroglobulin domain MG3